MTSFLTANFTNDSKHIFSEVNFPGSHLKYKFIEV